MSKKIFLTILSFIFLFSLFFPLFSLATEYKIECPTTTPQAPTAPPGIEVPLPGQPQPFLPDYVRWFFNFSVIIIGLIAFLALILGGFKYLTSTGDPEKISEAKKQIIAGFLGTILILSSWWILTTISPQLAMVSLQKPTPPPPPKGVPVLYIEKPILKATEIPWGKLLDDQSSKDYEGVIAETRLDRIKKIIGEINETAKEVRNYSAGIFFVSKFCNCEGFGECTGCISLADEKCLTKASCWLCWILGCECWEAKYVSDPCWLPVRLVLEDFQKKLKEKVRWLEYWHIRLEKEISKTIEKEIWYLARVKWLQKKSDLTDDLKDKLEGLENEILAELGLAKQEIEEFSLSNVTSEEECKMLGGYWYDGKCHEKPKELKKFEELPEDLRKAISDTTTTIEEIGRKWEKLATPIYFPKNIPNEVNCHSRIIIFFDQMRKRDEKRVNESIEKFQENIGQIPKIIEMLRGVDKIPDEAIKEFKRIPYEILRDVSSKIDDIAKIDFTEEFYISTKEKEERDKLKAEYEKKIKNNEIKAVCFQTYETTKIEDEKEITIYHLYIAYIDLLKVDEGINKLEEIKNISQEILTIKENIKNILSKKTSSVLATIANSKIASTKNPGNNPGIKEEIEKEIEELIKDFQAGIVQEITLTTKAVLKEIETLPEDIRKTAEGEIVGLKKIIDEKVKEIEEIKSKIEEIVNLPEKIKDILDIEIPRLFNILGDLKNIENKIKEIIATIESLTSFADILTAIEEVEQKIEQIREKLKEIGEKLATLKEDIEKCKACIAATEGLCAFICVPIIIIKIVDTVKKIKEVIDDLERIMELIKEILELPETIEKIRNLGKDIEYVVEEIKKFLELPETIKKIAEIPELWEEIKRVPKTMEEISELPKKIGELVEILKECAKCENLSAEFKKVLNEKKEILEKHMNYLAERLGLKSKSLFEEKLDELINKEIEKFLLEKINNVFGLKIKNAQALREIIEKKRKIKPGLKEALAELKEAEELMKSCYGARETKFFDLLDFNAFWLHKEALQYKLKQVEDIKIETKWPEIETKDDVATFYCQESPIGTLPRKAGISPELLKKWGGFKEMPKIYCNPDQKILVGSLIEKTKAKVERMIKEMEKISKLLWIEEIVAFWLTEQPDKFKCPNLCDCKCWIEWEDFKPKCKTRRCHNNERFYNEVVKYINLTSLGVLASDFSVRGSEVLEKIKKEWGEGPVDIIEEELKASYDIIKKDLSKTRENLEKCTTTPEDWVKARLGEKILRRQILECDIAKMVCFEPEIKDCNFDFFCGETESK